MKSQIIVLIVLLGALFLGSRYIYYGSLTRNCIYTEKKLPIPEELSKGEIIVAKDVYVAVGTDREYSCLKSMGSITREIVGPEVINNTTIGKRYFTDNGLRVDDLKTGTAFHVVDVIAVTKHGLTTMDSGAGPLYHLILKDKDNVSYQIATVMLGINRTGRFLSLVKAPLPASPSPVTVLSPDSFKTTHDFEGENSLEYIGNSR